MRFGNKTVLLFSLGLTLASCADPMGSLPGTPKPGTEEPPPPPPPPPPPEHPYTDSCDIDSQAISTFPTTPPTGANVMRVTVNGDLCDLGPNSTYPNEPCTSVTVCSPGYPGQCQTINHILVDTGSFGLRLFRSALTAVNPIPTTMSGLAECTQFGDGTSTWGPVEYLDVKLGDEAPRMMTVQLIDSNYSTKPAPCTEAQGHPATSPQSVGFNGILGVGAFVSDCGTVCSQRPANGLYYTCNGATCVDAAVPEYLQVSNPVARLPVDNNGVILALPSVPADGTTSIEGYLILGVGTQTNNLPPANAKVFAADQDGNMRTLFTPGSATAMASFLDSGTNFLNFTEPDGSHGAAISHCTGDYSTLFCPADEPSFTALNSGATGLTESCAEFELKNAQNLLAGTNKVFSTIGVAIPHSTPQFIWGLPFFFDKSVVIGFDGRDTVVGTGPFFCY